MEETARRVINEHVSVLLAIVGLILLTDALFGFSRPLPDGVLTLILGVFLGILGIFLYWTDREPDDQ